MTSRGDHYADLDHYAGLNVPRYTSYPTAASFTPSVSAIDQRKWLQALAPRQTASVYLHVPYCREICFYCGCNTKASRRSDVIGNYRDALAAEIVRAGQNVGKPVRITRIHWGGGTPSILGPDGLTTILQTLRRHFGFEAMDEHAIELDPRLVTRELAEGLATLGITRASLGVQDVNDQVQAAIGRVQPIASVVKAVNHLRDAGVARINFDLIYGLPHQTAASLAETCEAVLRLSPDRIAYYGYAHVPSMRTNQKLIAGHTLPSAAERVVQVRTIGDAMKKGGYIQVGIDHFACPDDSLVTAARTGRLRRNFQGYTDDPETVLLGFGASSISRLPQGYVQNVADPLRYVTAVSNGHFPAARGVRLEQRDWTRGRIIESLMCYFQADLQDIAPEISREHVAQLLQPMMKDGLVQMRDGVVFATETGRPFIRVIASAFDEFIQPLSQSFSQAI